MSPELRCLVWFTAWREAEKSRQRNQGSERITDLDAWYQYRTKATLSSSPPEMTHTQLLTIARRLQALSEFALTCDVIQPLMSALGYLKVEYYGGTDEEGKDIICWGEDRLGGIEVAVIQVKRYKASKRAADTKSFSEIITQLSQATEKPIPHVAGVTFLPTSVYFITPYIIDTKSLKSRFEAVQALRGRNVKIIDGLHLAQLAASRLPQVITQFCGPLFNINDKIHPTLTNEVLLAALDAPQYARSVGHFYIDIDISIGQLSLQAFLQSDYEPQLVTHSLSPKDWHSFKTACIDVKRMLEVHPLTRPIARIEREFLEIEGKNKKAQERIGAINARIKELVEERVGLARLVEREHAELRAQDITLVALERDTAALRKQLTAVRDQQDVRETKLLTNLVNALAPNVRDTLVSELCHPRKHQKVTIATEPQQKQDLHLAIDQLRYLIHRPHGKRSVKESPALLNLVQESREQTIRDGELALIRSQEEQLSTNINRNDKEINSRIPAAIMVRISRMSKCDREIDKLRARLKAAQTEVCAPQYTVTIDSAGILGVLARRRAWIKENIRQINKKTPSNSELTGFLTEVQHLFKVLGLLLRSPFFSGVFSVTKDIMSTQEADDYRLSIPLDVLFSTRLNIAVTGDAGAGKTTALQKYAASALQERREGELVMYMPFPKLFQAWQKGDPSIIQDKEHVQERLDDGIYWFLDSIGIRIDSGELKALLRDEGAILLLDGIDEVTKSHPRVIPAIECLAKTYPKVQIVTSARTSERAIEKMAFMQIVLLPFTDSQRELFFRRWFATEEKAVKRIMSHLIRNKQLGDVVRNPLLATILCVLEQNKVPLPENEIQLYGERLRLLVGDYDAQKGINRLTMRREDLKVIAEKLAFRLHSEGKREVTREQLVEWARDCLGRRLRKKECDKIVEELVHPTNILIPVKVNGAFGFGHLRYQEHLCAMELSKNRDIDILPMLPRPWWRGVLILFSQMSSTIDWIIREHIDKRGNMEPVAETLLAMIAVRPYKERRRLTALVQEHVELEEHYDRFRAIRSIE